MREIGIGLAGAGYWGSKLARNLHEAPGLRLAAVCDPDAVRREDATRRYSGCRGLSSFDELLADETLDAVVLATPASLHADHAERALRAGKHVLVEKPLALSSDECGRLDALATEQGLVLMVGHTFLYSEPVRRLRQMIEAGELGEVAYIYGQRLNLGVIRDDLNALWNFGPHDISILLHLLGEFPVRVSARQFELLNRGIEDVAFVVLEFPSGVVGHIHHSWLDPRKVRDLTVVGTRKMVVYDDTDVEAPLRIYDKGVVPAARPDEGPGFGEFKLEVRAGDLLIPRLKAGEPLRAEVEHFAQCVVRGSRPLTDATHGRDVVAILEAAERSAADGGRKVELREVRAPDRAPA
jgi:predicted dehydrogenase